eukprot:3941096-Rhodomonas_salina.1
MQSRRTANVAPRSSRAICCSAAWCGQVRKAHPHHPAASGPRLVRKAHPHHPAIPARTRPRLLLRVPLWQALGGASCTAAPLRFLLLLCTWQQRHLFLQRPPRQPAVGPGQPPASCGGEVSGVDEQIPEEHCLPPHPLSRRRLLLAPPLAQPLPSRHSTP